MGSVSWFDSLSQSERQRGAVMCSECPAGFYSDQPAQSFCAECPAGSASTANRTGCGICEAGRFISANRECEGCAAGQYQGSSGQSACHLCSAGSTTDTLEDAGASTCTACARGQYTERSTVACTDCAQFDTPVVNCTATCADTTFAANPSDAVPYDCSGHINDLAWVPEETVCSVARCTGNDCCINVPLDIARLQFDEALAAGDPRSAWWKVSTTLLCLIHISHLGLSSARAQFEEDLKVELAGALGDGSLISIDDLVIDDVQATDSVSDSTSWRRRWWWTRSCRS